MDIEIKISQHELDALNLAERAGVLYMINSVHDAQDTGIIYVNCKFGMRELGAITIQGRVPLDRIWTLFDRLRPKVYDGPTIVMGVDIS